MITLAIDGRDISVPEGTTVWEAAKKLGVDIPVLCHQSRLRPVGVCRMCVVDVGGRTLAASCVRACDPGMQVQTHSESVERHRRTLLQLLLAEHPAPCEREKTLGDCELEALARRYDVHSLPIVDGADLRDAFALNGKRRADNSSPVIAVDHPARILCDR